MPIHTYPCQCGNVNEVLFMMFRDVTDSHQCPSCGRLNARAFPVVAKPAAINHMGTYDAGLGITYHTDKEYFAEAEKQGYAPACDMTSQIEKGIALNKEYIAVGERIRLETEDLKSKGLPDYAAENIAYENNFRDSEVMVKEDEHSYIDELLDSDPELAQAFEEAG